MKGEANIDALQRYSTVADQAAAATITIAADADHYWCLDSIHFSIGTAIDAAAPVALTVVFGSTTLFTGKVNATATGVLGIQEPIIFPRGLYRKVYNEAMVVTIANPGGTVTLDMTITYR